MENFTPSNIYRSVTLEIDIGGDGWLLFSARHPKIASRLARLLGTYEGHIWRAGDEGLFKVYPKDGVQVCKTLGLPEGTTQAIKRFFNT